MARPRWFDPVLLFAGALCLSACQSKLDDAAFRRKIEVLYAEVHPGWTIYRREPAKTIFVRGDQFDTLETTQLFETYQAKGVSGSEFLDSWRVEEEKAAKARRRTLEQAKDGLIPMVKSGAWIRVQDLGAIGPEAQDKLRPWRRQVASEVFVVLGIPEDRLGYRLPSIDELKTSTGNEDEWLARALANVERQVATSSVGVEIRSQTGRLMVYDLPNVDGVSGLVLDPKFRGSMLEKFARDHLGAAVPLRNVLVVFDPEEPAALRPVRARAHQLYDTQNHYGFRGLLRFDAASVTVLEPADPSARTQTTP